MAMARKIIGIVLCLFLELCSGASHRRSLMRYLVEGYDKLSLPEGSPLNVSHSIQLKRILSLENQVLSLDAYLSMKWLDDQLTWTPEQFGGIKLIQIPSHILWQPDIMLENNAERFNGVHKGDINMVIAYDGVVFYIPPVKISSYCTVNRSDIVRRKEITCSLTFMSWSYNGLSINLIADAVGVSLRGFDEQFNKDWMMVDVSMKRHVRIYSCCPEPYIDITYNLVLKKK